MFAWKKFIHLILLHWSLFYIYLSTSLFFMNMLSVEQNTQTQTKNFNPLWCFNSTVSIPILTKLKTFCLFIFTDVSIFIKNCKWQLTGKRYFIHFLLHSKLENSVCIFRTLHTYSTPFLCLCGVTMHIQKRADLVLQMLLLFDLLVFSGGLCFLKCNALIILKFFRLGS